MCLNPLTFSIADTSLLAREASEGRKTYEEALWHWFFLEPGIRAFIAGRTIYGYEESKCVHGGKRFVYFKDNRKAVICAATWVLGNAPPSIADNAMFITRQQYERLSIRSVQCNFKGCFDRYHCHWYDLGNEKDGAWNEIPQDWVIGDEKCESFTPKII